jgi:aminocarboxymuconate-semialdehyde decarboxylase
VSVQLLSGWMDLAATALPATVATRYARMFNEALVQDAAAEPDRFRCFATLPLQSPTDAVAELQHAVAELGMVGAEIGTTVGGQDLDDPGLEPFWSAAEELGCLLLLHPCESLAGRGVTRHFLANTVGNPAESTIAVGHLVFGGVLERHPDLRMVVVHGGGFAPYQLGRWDHAFEHDVRGAAANLTRPPSQWVGRLYHDTVLHSSRSLELLVDVVGPGRVVLGSDYPFEMGEADPVRVVESLPGVSDADRALILHGNIDRLLTTLS